MFDRLRRFVKENILEPIREVFKREVEPPPPQAKPEPIETGPPEREPEPERPADAFQFILEPEQDTG